MILDGFDAAAVEQAAQAIRAGGLVGLPTETVYGLAADASRADAVARIFAAKGRPSDHPLIVHVAEPAAVAHFAAAVPDFAQRLMTAFWPGPLTLILPRRHGVAAASAGGQDSIGLRCPSHPVALALLRRLCTGVESPVWGLAAPSANQFGRVSPTTAAHVQGEFGDDLLILDGGACPVGIESTIIDCTRGVPVLLRPGVLTRDEVQRACGQSVLLKDEVPAHTEPGPRASGTLASHYAPRAKVRLMDARALRTALDVLGAGSAAVPQIGVYARSSLGPLSQLQSPPYVLKRMPADPTAAAQALFADLRELDAQGLKLLWVETPPDHPAWDGVRDRLQRAAA
ncbi:MAG: hypothetical protein RLZZ591_2690 [Pseudomonadota bacterium]|jgi:L-threonylcarbamoyladenylate synthase